MSQEFDINRDLWDMYDDNSRRIVHFYESPSPDILDDPQQILDLMSHLDSEDKKQKEVRVVTQENKAHKKTRKNTNPVDEIFVHMQEKTQNK